MSEIPMYPNELECACGLGKHANPWQCVAYLEERVANLTIVLREVRKHIPGRVPQDFAAQIDVLLDGQVPSP